MWILNGKDWKYITETNGKKTNDIVLVDIPEGQVVLKEKKVRKTRTKKEVA
jgi:hypothetical protein